MIKIETIEVSGWIGAIRGMRNPYMSHDKSDSIICSECPNANKEGICIDPKTGTVCQGFLMGYNDMTLCKKLIKSGPEHRKFLRMIHVQADVVAPSYWISEFATYKIGVTMNSSSLQHLGAKREYSIRDFSIDDGRIYEILDWKPTDHKSKHPLILSEDGANEFKIYNCGGREYKVFKNGRIVRCAFDIEDKGMNRTRHFEEKEIKLTQTPFGYYMCNLGGKGYFEKWMVHRLVAMLWHPETFSPELTVNHIDHQKGNNHADNLEWVTLEENIKDQNQSGLNVPTLHSSYMAFKSSMKADPSTIFAMREDLENGLNYSEIARKYGISQGQTWTLLTNREQSLNRELFLECYMWEKLIDEMNRLRGIYNETKDYEYFRLLRQIIPMSFNYHITIDTNYEALLSIYHQRKNHRLTEWQKFCEWVEGLPYMKEFLFSAEMKEAMEA